jgi:hypothetical protein
MSGMWLALLGTLAVSVLVQGLLVWGFVRRLRSTPPPLLDDAACPAAAVILCLRGSDPFLPRCLDGLLSQAYPRYQVHFVVDHPSDPALPLVQQALERHGFERYTLHFLETPLATCSLKCSSLVQAYTALPEDVEFIAQLDADTIPHATWLRELATGLAPADVGAATGNRWYAPDTASLPAQIRAVWNAAAIVQMYWYGIAWGGTLAVKVSAIREAGLDTLWQQALCEDTMLRKQLQRIGRKVAFVPGLMMINREDCTLASFVPWVARQLLTARLYHPAWLAVAGHGLSSAMISVWGWGWGVFCCLTGALSEGLATLAAMSIFQLLLVAMIPWIEAAVAWRVAGRGDTARTRRPCSWTRLLVVVSATQWVYTRALVLCLLMRRVEWRGVHYQVDGPWKIRMSGYQPYAQSVAAPVDQQSL